MYDLYYEIFKRQTPWRTIAGINKEMDGLKEQKQAIKKLPTQKHHKKVIKDINRRIRDLDLVRRTKTSPTSGDRYDPPTTEVIPEDTAYTYKGNDKPKRKKKKNGTAQKARGKMEECHNTRRNVWRKKQKKESKKDKKKKKEG